MFDPGSSEYSVWDFCVTRQYPLVLGRVIATGATRQVIEITWTCFGSAARGDRIHRAGHALGQLLRTVYLCDYFRLPDFRRPLYRVLERGESVHAPQRQICTQPLPAKRGRCTEELIATSGALTVVTNCVMAWNTQRLQRAVDRERHRVAPRYQYILWRSRSAAPAPDRGRHLLPYTAIGPRKE